MTLTQPISYQKSVTLPYFSLLMNFSNHHYLIKEIQQMIESLIQHCQEQQQAFQSARTIILKQTNYQTIDFITVAWLIHSLNKGNQVTFIAFRQNYAHYIALSKKIGKSIEGYLKAKQLNYIECFQSQFCSQLPLTQSQPATYTPPSTLVRKLYSKDLVKENNIFEGVDMVVVDSIGYVEDQVDVCFWLYEQAMLNGCRLLLGGCDNEGAVSGVLERQAQLLIQLEREVGGFGRLQVVSSGRASIVLWRTLKGHVQFSQQIAI